MSARRWLLALAVIPAVLLVGAIALAVVAVTQMGWAGFRDSHLIANRGWGVLGIVAFMGIVVSQPIASAWLLVGVVPGRRPWLLPGLCSLTGWVLALALVWSTQVVGVTGFPDTAIIAGGSTMLALPICTAGLICCHHMRDPEKAWFFRPLARVFFAAAVLFGTLQIAVPLDCALYRRNVEKAKAFVESVALEVQRESRAMGTPPEGIDGLLSRLDRWPLSVLHTGLEYTRKEDGFLLEFRSSPGMMSDDFWTYHVPPGAWKYRTH